jgi:hypothetical protein
MLPFLFVALLCLALIMQTGSSLCHGFCCAMGQAWLFGWLAELLFDAVLYTLLLLIFHPCLLGR